MCVCTRTQPQSHTYLYVWLRNWTRDLQTFSDFYQTIVKHFKIKCVETLNRVTRTMPVVTRLPAQMLRQARDAHVPATVQVGTLPAKSGRVSFLTHRARPREGPSHIRVHQLPHAKGGHRNKSVDVHTRYTDKRFMHVLVY